MANLVGNVHLSPTSSTSFVGLLERMVSAIEVDRAVIGTDLSLAHCRAQVGGFAFSDLGDRQLGITPARIARQLLWYVAGVTESMHNTAESTRRMARTWLK